MSLSSAYTMTLYHTVRNSDRDDLEPNTFRMGNGVTTDSDAIHGATLWLSSCRTISRATVHHGDRLVFDSREEVTTLAV